MTPEDRFLLTRHIVRYAARCRRRNYDAVPRLLDACEQAMGAGLEEGVLLPGLVVLRQTSKAFGFPESSIPPELQAVLATAETLAVEQARQLRRLADALVTEAGEVVSRTLLLGDGALLVGLYEHLGAFPASEWTAGVAGVHPLRPAVEAILHPRAGIEMVNLDDLTEVGDHAHLEEVDGLRWIVPDPRLLVALLAARVGDSMAHPDPPVWHHLGFAVKSWQDDLEPETVLSLADRLGLGKAVHRGLAVAVHLFPELERWLPKDRLRISRLERRLAIPLAARKLLQTEAAGAQTAAP